jgi:hypothetical protein
MLQGTQNTDPDFGFWLMALQPVTAYHFKSGDSYSLFILHPNVLCHFSGKGKLGMVYAGMRSPSQ